LIGFLLIFKKKIYEDNFRKTRKRTQEYCRISRIDARIAEIRP